MQENPFSVNSTSVLGELPLQSRIAHYFGIISYAMDVGGNVDCSSVLPMLGC